MFVNNLWAILLAAIAGMVIGYLWYSKALFGEMWMKAKGKKMSDMKPSSMALIWQFIDLLVVASVLALLIVASGATRASGGALIGFYVSLIVACAFFTGTLFGGVSKKIFLIDALHYIVMLVVMGLVLGAFAW